MKNKNIFFLRLHLVYVFVVVGIQYTQYIQYTLLRGGGKSVTESYPSCVTRQGQDRNYVQVV